MLTLPARKLLFAAFNYIQALLSSVERKNGWQVAEQVGDANPYRVQHLLGRAQWDETQLCQEVRQYGVEGLGELEDIFAVDETGFLKQGDESYQFFKVKLQMI